MKRNQNRKRIKECVRKAEQEQNSKDLQREAQIRPLDIERPFEQSALGANRTARYAKLRQLKTELGITGFAAIERE